MTKWVIDKIATAAWDYVNHRNLVDRFVAHGHLQKNINKEVALRDEKYEALKAMLEAE